jgi:hypothetical protein
MCRYSAFTAFVERLSRAQNLLPFELLRSVGTSRRLHHYNISLQCLPHGRIPLTPVSWQPPLMLALSRRQHRRAQQAFRRQQRMFLRRADTNSERYSVGIYHDNEPHMKLIKLKKRVHQHSETYHSPRPRKAHTSSEHGESLSRWYTLVSARHAERENPMRSCTK